MSGEINNREYRKNVIKEILTDLHDGKSLEYAREKFVAVFNGVAYSEVAAAEAALLADGVPVTEVQRLCDVHAALFEDAFVREESPLTSADLAERPGHPAHTMKLENRAIEELLDESVQPALDAFAARGDGASREKLLAALNMLAEIKPHYQRKENLIFPHMEKHGITAPPKVMWGVDDEIRSGISAVTGLAADGTAAPQKVREAADELILKIREMISKEENIMLPMILEVFTQDEWKRIADESGEIGYSFIDPPTALQARAETAPAPSAVQDYAAGSLALPTGVLRMEELVGIFNTLPVDITFVDKDDTVKYFSQGEERVFPRTGSVIGRKVVNCHPPASVHIVEGILSDFKAGKKTHEDFWINMGGKTVYIRYFAVRGAGGEYLGTLEVTQNIAPIQALTGEKRLVAH